MNETGQKITVPVSVLRDLLERLLQAAGCSRQNSSIVARGFLDADVHGHALQGLDHIWTTLGDLRLGKMNGNACPRIVKETAATALVDGDAGPGQVGGMFACDVAVRKARESGSCAIGIRGAGDVFRLGGYTEAIALEGLVGVMMSYSIPARVHPFGGNEPVLGTNPVSIAIPTGGDPIVLDMATSASAVGHIRLASYSGDPIPAGLAVGRDGQPTTDAAEALRGAIAPLGGSKGFGLGLCVALMSGPLVGGLLGQELDDALEGDHQGSAYRGHLIIALDPASFGDSTEFRRSVDRYAEEIRSSRRAVGVAAIQMPGQRGMAEQKRVKNEGVSIYESVWRNTAKLAAELRVEMPRLENGDWVEERCGYE
ncbi:MAG: Ldh family oxidoreductase [Rhodospirillales bacterium]|nr:Ldh family oxidoreductase [Rhodospirillales bacterium]